MRQNMQRGIATRLHELSTEFRKLQVRVCALGRRAPGPRHLCSILRLQKMYVADLKKMSSKSSIESLIGSSGGAAGGDEEDEQDEGMSDAQMSAMANMQEDADERVREIQVRRPSTPLGSCVCLPYVFAPVYLCSELPSPWRSLPFCFGS